MTFTVKVRGARGPMLSEYRCPVHGVFTALVERDANGDPPEAAPCTTFAPLSGLSAKSPNCERMSPWTASAPAVHTMFVVSATQGRSDPKPHPYAMDTRLIAEGRKNEYRAQRKKIRQELRHKRRQEFLK